MSLNPFPKNKHWQSDETRRKRNRYEQQELEDYEEDEDDYENDDEDDEDDEEEPVVRPRRKPVRKSRPKVKRKPHREKPSKRKPVTRYREESGNPVVNFINIWICAVWAAVALGIFCFANRDNTTVDNNVKTMQNVINKIDMDDTTK